MGPPVINPMENDDIKTDFRHLMNIRKSRI